MKLDYAEWPTLIILHLLTKGPSINDPKNLSGELTRSNTSFIIQLLLMELGNICGMEFYHF